MIKDRLERIIEIKEKLMDDKEREIEEEKNKLDSTNQAIKAVDADINMNYERMTTKSIKGNDFSVITGYIEYLDSVKSSLIEESESLQQKIALLKEELIDLLKEIKMLGTLKDKISAALKKSINRREQKLLDDIALRVDEKKIQIR
jgi:flagellar export protein FliJ